MPFKFEVRSSEIINNVKIINPSIFKEPRGSIWTSYYSNELDKLLPKDIYFKHDKFSTSFKSVLRGIHGDNKSWKLVSCISGSIFQVVVDLRQDSKTYLQWESFDLDPNNRQMILIPPGLGNAFCVTSNLATYHYKLAYEGDYIDADNQFTISWNDPRIDIKWPTNQPILSERDSEVKNGNN